MSEPLCPSPFAGPCSDRSLTEAAEAHWADLRKANGRGCTPCDAEKETNSSCGRGSSSSSSEPLEFLMISRYFRPRPATLRGFLGHAAHSVLWSDPTLALVMTSAGVWGSPMWQAHKSPSVSLRPPWEHASLVSVAFVSWAANTRPHTLGL